MFALAGVLLCSWLLWSRAELLVVRNAEGVVVLEAPLPSGSEFGLRFVHSVAKSPVEEWFCAQDGSIVLRRAVYQDFGAGLAHEPGPGQRMDFENGRMTLAGFDMHLPQLTVRVGRVAQHELLLPGGGGHRARDLASLAPPGSALTFTVEHGVYFGEGQ